MGENEKMLDSLRRLCSRRECCSSEIKRKIRLKGGLDEEAILSSLCKDGYLSDRRYASAFARDKSSLDGWGTVKIRYALKNKDIDEEIIREAIADVDATLAENRLRKLLESRYRVLRDDPQRRLKILRWALGRGYTYEEISPLLEDLEKGGCGCDG